MKKFIFLSLILIVFNRMHGHTTYCIDTDTANRLNNAQNRNDWKEVKRIYDSGCGLSHYDVNCPIDFASDTGTNHCLAVELKQWPIPTNTSR